MRLYLLAVLLPVVATYVVDDGCSGRCCTLEIFRPVGDDDKYSGVYRRRRGVYVMKGNPNVTMEVIDSEFYDEAEEDYVTMENWGIMDRSQRFEWQRERPVIEGSISGEDPVGDWPNGGEAECLKTNKKGICKKLRYTHARGENGIYEQLVGGSNGWKSWKQAGNIFWFFSFNDEHEEHNVHEGGFTEWEDQDYFEDYSDDKSGGTLEGEWTDGTVINCVGED